MTDAKSEKTEPLNATSTAAGEKHHRIEITPDQFDEFLKIGKRAVIKDAENGRIVHVSQSGRVKFDTWWKVGTFIFMLIFMYWAVPLTKTVNSNYAMLNIGPRYTADQGNALELRTAKLEGAILRLEAKVDRDDKQEIRIASIETVLSSMKIPPPWFEEMVRKNTQQIGDNAKMIERLAVAMEFHNKSDEVFHKDMIQKGRVPQQ